MDQPNFPLLKLPFLTLILVLEMMDFVQLFNLAQISKRMKRIVRDRVKIKGYSLELYMTTEIGFQFKRNDGRSPALMNVYDAVQAPPDVQFLQGNRQFKTEHFEKDISLSLLKTYWINLLEGLKEIYEEITEIFCMPLDKFIITVEETEIDYKEYVPWFSTLTPRYSVIQFVGENCDYPKYWHSIRGINFGPHAQSQKISEGQPSILNFDRVYISYGQSIKVDQVLAMDAIDIAIHNVNFSVTDFDTLLRNLATGSMRRLVIMELGSTRELRPNNTLLALNAEQKNGHTFKIPMNNRECELTFTFTIAEEMYWYDFKMEEIVKDQN